MNVVISGAKSFAADNLSGFVSATAVSLRPLTAVIARLCSSPIAPYASKPTLMSFTLSDTQTP